MVNFTSILKIRVYKYVVWCHFHKVLESAELIYGARNQVSGYFQDGRLTGKGHKGIFWGNANVLYIQLYAWDGPFHSM